MLLSIYHRHKNTVEKANQNSRGTLYFTISHSKCHEFSVYLRVISKKLGLAQNGPIKRAYSHFLHNVLHSCSTKT